MSTPTPKTLRHKQFAPTAACLEDIYAGLREADLRILGADYTSDETRALARAVRHLIADVSLLADIVDRHITAPDLESRVDSNA